MFWACSVSPFSTFDDEKIKVQVYKDWIPKDLTSGVIHKCQCELCHEFYYSEYVRHLNVRISENIGISLLTKKQGLRTSP